MAAEPAHADRSVGAGRCTCFDAFPVRCPFAPEGHEHYHTPARKPCPVHEPACTCLQIGDGYTVTSVERHPCPVH